MKLVGGEIGAVGLHSAPGLLAEFVDADRAQEPAPDVFVPVLTVIEGAIPHWDIPCIRRDQV
jgi:proteasome lid subunit RPN8/RPN11